MIFVSLLRTSMVKEHSLAMDVTPVPPCTVETLKIVNGSRGTRSWEIRAMARPMHSTGFTRP